MKDQKLLIDKWRFSAAYQNNKGEKLHVICDKTTEYGEDMYIINFDNGTSIIGHLDVLWLENKELYYDENE